MNSPIRFGTDGWRAVMAEEFTFPNVRKVAWALGQWVSQNAPGVPVFVGYDNRFASKEFASEAAAVLAATGAQTRLAGHVLPTPAYSFLAKKHSGYSLVVTASHNPPLHNGLKIKTSDGAPAPISLTRQIEELIVQAPPKPSKIRCLSDTTLRKQYLDYLKGLAKGVRSRIKSKKIVVDYLHGSGAGFLGEILGDSVVALRENRDPDFGGIAPEPVEKNMHDLKARVVKSKAFLGVALDGDGDRIALVDEKGRYLAPSVVFPMYAYHQAVVRHGQGEVVQGVSLGYLAQRIAQKAGLPFSWVPVGFKNIAEKMAQGGVLLGGEESGGYALASLLPDRDGSINALLMLDLLLDLGLKPSQMVDQICSEYGGSCYERRDLHLNQPVDDVRLKTAVENELMDLLTSNGFRVTSRLTIDGLKAFFEDGSWILLRASGTEPLVRVYVETPTKKMTRQILDFAVKWVEDKVNSGAMAAKEENARLRDLR